ncbi:hypothetical protein ACN20G_08195 [Streptomyces sp. BI20]|uniref:SCO4983 family protein n=1 Tax=Streptomyces sp. BI20 TaxID=3403460 RepID=UPI003C7226E1
MYEPTRTKSVHRPSGGPGSPTHRADYPHRSRGEELDAQLATHLGALLTVTDELGLTEAADVLAERIDRVRGARPSRLPAHQAPTGETARALHRRAHDLAGRALVVAASRADTASAILAATRMDAHAAALDLAGAH